MKPTRLVLVLFCCGAVSGCPSVSELKPCQALIDCQGEGADELANPDAVWACVAGKCVSRLCPNGILDDPAETCDDGNRSDNDGCTADCQITYCGDGILRSDQEAGEPGFEACDDGNAVDDDGCRGDCSALAACGDGVQRLDIAVGETGYEACDDGNLDDDDACRGDCSALAGCGDGVLRKDLLPGEPDYEECDDGNLVGADGCDALCLREFCGNGRRELDEACDDGNDDDRDACQRSCLVAICGDGVVRNDLEPGDEGFENCDDGNDTDADGCDSNCRLTGCGSGVVTEGETCDDGNDVDTDACLSNCLPAVCGDGYVHDGVEACDDGNDEEGDACLNNCEIARCGDGHRQLGVEFCDDGNDSDADFCLSNCRTARCGDGQIRTAVGGEEAEDDCGERCENWACRTNCLINLVDAELCDDGNANDRDACRNDCQPAICGDGILRVDLEAGEEGAEACDHGQAWKEENEWEEFELGVCAYGLRNCEVCSQACQLIPGATAYCGDGEINGAEECDDGNASDEDACTNTCRHTRCGDGILRGGLEPGEAGYEECDDGNELNGDGCDRNCRPTGCGNGEISEGEECDDGNDQELDACRNNCVIGRCGDLLVRQDVDGDGQRFENCDDGNDEDWDRCSSSCFLRDGASRGTPSRTCRTLLEHFPETETGSYWIQPEGLDAAALRSCEMELAGGGWTVTTKFGSGRYYNWGGSRERSINPWGWDTSIRTSSLWSMNRIMLGWRFENAAYHEHPEGYIVWNGSYEDFNSGPYDMAVGPPFSECPGRHAEYTTGWCSIYHRACNCHGPSQEWSDHKILAQSGDFSGRIGFGHFVGPTRELEDGCGSSTTPWWSPELHPPDMTSSCSDYDDGHFWVAVKNVPLNPTGSTCDNGPSCEGGVCLGRNDVGAFTGGYCSRTCTEGGEECSDAELCKLTHTGERHCLRRCEQNDDCGREGYQCRGGVCYDGPSGAHGGACVSGLDCEGGLCYPQLDATLFGGGYCTAACEGLNGDCGPNGSCLEMAEDQWYCFAGCGEENCSRDAHTCHDWLNICLDGGYLGGACLNDSWCRGDMVCWEGENAYRRGYCTMPCTEGGNECGPEGRCIQAGDEWWCFQACDEGVCHREGYSCIGGDFCYDG